MTGAASSEREALGYMTNMIPAAGDDPATMLSKLQAMRLRLHALESLDRGDAWKRCRWKPAIASYPAKTELGKPISK
jgi:hypothetical protein